MGATAGGSPHDLAAGLVDEWVLPETEMRGPLRRTARRGLDSPPIGFPTQRQNKLRDPLLGAQERWAASKTATPQTKLRGPVSVTCNGSNFVIGILPNLIYLILLLI